MTASEIRKAFLDFFKEKGHTIVPSAPIVVKNDPTLLFTNAGMNQFKDYFLGNKRPDHKRVADTQKCLRVSGKHNDLEEVGVDTYHHTMFEMLGNWSFGDYFKKEAIAWSWELLTAVYKIDPNLIYVTVFEGDEGQGLEFDQEAYDEWRKWVPEDRILRGNKKDNFWEMGETGPCGPCSEIHIDCRSEEERRLVDGATLINADHPQVIEIWNNVFMQFNRLKDGRLENLPEKHVDTGMGFERLVRVLQGKQSNYDTDVFSVTIAELEKITGLKYDGSDSRQAIAFRVLSDHIRAVAFSIADGQLPSNTGAGYVIRRILRRAVRYYYSNLNYAQPLLYQLVPTLAKQFEGVFPELGQQQKFISNAIKEEEESFLNTLEKGLKKIDEIIQNPKNATISGKDAFELYDTYGFPLDLTRLIASENNLKIDEDAFKSEMQQQKDRSRAATSIDAEDWVNVTESKAQGFVGYQDLKVQTRVSRYRRVKAKGKTQYQIVLETTPFYAESGGQVGDSGTLYFEDDKINITDTKKENDLIIHFADKLPDDLSKEVLAEVDQTRRRQIANNHSATHLLHAALKEVLGTHANQKGSLVSPDLLRFDFSHYSKLTQEEIDQVQQVVNEKIRKNIPVVVEEMTKDAAESRGAMALFGEKYGDNVRVVTIDPTFSVELCGGTHVAHTGTIGLFVIISESAIASGVRRIEALTGEAAFEYLHTRQKEHKKLSEILKSNDPIKAAEKLLEDRTKLERQIERMESRHLLHLRDQVLEKTETFERATEKGVLQVRFIGSKVEVGSADSLKRLAHDLQNQCKDSLVILTAEIDKRPNVALAVSPSLNEALRLNAATIIKSTVARLIQGGGGGQATLATAGGKNVNGLEEAIAQVRKLITES